MTFIGHLLRDFSIYLVYALATSCKELTHWKRPWCWEGLGAGGEGDDRGWDGWMASLTRWTWVSVNSRSWCGTGRPGVLRFMGSQRVGHNWATDLIWSDLIGNLQLQKINLENELEKVNFLTFSYRLLVFWFKMRVNKITLIWEEKCSFFHFLAHKRKCKTWLKIRSL